MLFEKRRLLFILFLINTFSYGQEITEIKSISIIKTQKDQVSDVPPRKLVFDTDIPVFRNPKYGDVKEIYSVSEVPNPKKMVEMDIFLISTII